MIPGTLTNYVDCRGADSSRHLLHTGITPFLPFGIPDLVTPLFLTWFHDVLNFQFKATGPSQAGGPGGHTFCQIS